MIKKKKNKINSYFMKGFANICLVACALFILANKANATEVLPQGEIGSTVYTRQESFVYFKEEEGSSIMGCIAKAEPITILSVEKKRYSFLIEGVTGYIDIKDTVTESPVLREQVEKDYSVDILAQEKQSILLPTSHLSKTMGNIENSNLTKYLSTADPDDDYIIIQESDHIYLQGIILACLKENKKKEVQIRYCPNGVIPTVTLTIPLQDVFSIDKKYDLGFELKNSKVKFNEEPKIKIESKVRASQFTTKEITKIKQDEEKKLKKKNEGTSILGTKAIIVITGVIVIGLLISIVKQKIDHVKGMEYNKKRNKE